VSHTEKPLVWRHGAVKTPPFSKGARLEAGYLLRKLQQGESLSLPHSRPMPEVGRRCHELRITDRNKNWRIIYAARSDAVVVLEVFAKTTKKTPSPTIQVCRERLKDYENA
jgi:phage-related protein